MASPRVLVIAGYGLNCEDETLFAFRKAGADGDIIHVNDIIDSPEILKKYHILAVPGGFSYGDDTGSGNALANRLRHNLWDALRAFVERDTLTIGICNGCQTLVNLGLVPALDGAYGERQVALLLNASFRYQCRWVDVKVEANGSPWLKGIEQMHIPVAHGEGNFAMDAAILDQLDSKGHIALRYVHPDGTPANGVFPVNPNGAIADMAGLCDASGRVFALMPHPERALNFTQGDNWTAEADRFAREGKALPEEGDGMALFRNGVGYFS